MNAPVARDRAFSRLPMLTIFAGAAGSIALPWVPNALTTRVRGAIAEDIASRKGLSLTPEARDTLSALAFEQAGLRPISRILRFSAARVALRFLPLGAVLPGTLAAFSAFALGHLFERYLTQHRTSAATRIDEEEARRIRTALDLAVLHILRARPASSSKGDSKSEDLRDAVTQLVDKVLLGAATVPSLVLERLEAAFDESFIA